MCTISYISLFSPQDSIIKATAFVDGAQEDCHEFMIWLLDLLPKNSQVMFKRFIILYATINKICSFHCCRLPSDINLILLYPVRYARNDLSQPMIFCVYQFNYHLRIREICNLNNVWSNTVWLRSYLLTDGGNAQNATIKSHQKNRWLSEHCQKSSPSI